MHYLADSPTRENIKAARLRQCLLGKWFFLWLQREKRPSRSGYPPSACVPESASKLSSQNFLVRKVIILFAFLKPGDVHPSVIFPLPGRSLQRLFLLSLFLFLSAAVVNRQLTRWQMSTGRVETTCCMGRKTCSNKVRKIHNSNKKPVTEREREHFKLTQLERT